MPKGSCVSKLTNEKPCRVFSPTNSSFGPETTCRYLPQLNDTELEKCTRPQTYDYFSGSVTSYILTFLFTGIVITGIYIGVNFWVFLKEKKKKKFLLKTIKLKKGEFKCKERVSFLEKRVVIITFEPSSVQILVKSNIGKVLRVIELSHLESITLFTTENLDRIVIRAENHYDLYLLFSNNLYAHQLTEKLTEFCHEVEKTIFEYEKTVTEINSNIITFKDRQEQLKEVLDSVLNLNTTQKMKSKKMTSKNSNISKIQLTKYELANALGMTPDNNFFKQFFYLMDKDQNGFVTFQEFLSVMTMFTSGTEEEKAFLFFNIYDLDHSGFLTVNDFKIFIESTASQDLQGQNTSQIVESMLSLVNLRPGEKMSFDKFFEIFKSNKMFKLCVPSLMNRKSLGPQNSRFSLYGDLPEITITDEELEAKDEADDKTDRDIGGESNGKHLSYFHELFCRFSNHVRSHEKVFFWGCLYTIVMILIFAERAYYYSVEREHVGLRRIAGYGVTVTRGAASAMMFTYSSLLVTMCRNIFSTLRTHVLPKFQYWCWETVTGLTGIFLTIHVAVIYVFASEARRHLYKAFWWTHSTHPLFFFLMILHGSGQLVQPHFFHFFFLGPCFSSVFDKMVLYQERIIKINVLGAKHLPSSGGIGVTPFASILKDIAFKSKQPISSFKCKKVIFLWVTRSQKQFEWMTDILRQVEEADNKNLIQIHIFITQFKSKYDFRTTMLFHAERHFQKLSGTSMFTGLRALTHFSRPNFAKVFQAIKEKYKTAPIVAVFTCGSLALSASVDSGCREVNKGNDPVFKHYYENF
ncbi:Respiratory burst oxidase-like protein A [Armadillidium nasatum]|uniref:Respiratory burst oxidase-like protein A n=1 Tax=Armadillidium nasatum TaxID=96803 RepID=A0A5N5TJ99_9CRUS|nr:Respiratory burst oxidase-like protein A [Armadillidium nasatum]